MVCSHHDGLFCRVNNASELAACISDIAAYKICDLIAVALCELAAFFHVLGVLCGIINALLLLALVAYFFASFDLSRASAALFFLTSSGDIFSCACFHSAYLSFGILTVNPLRDVVYTYSIIVYLLCVIVSGRRCCFGAHHAVSAHLIRNVRLCRAEYGHFAERGLVRALLPHLINSIERRFKRLRRCRIEIVCALDHFRRNFILTSHTVYDNGLAVFVRCCSADIINNAVTGHLIYSILHSGIAYRRILRTAELLTARCKCCCLCRVIIDEYTRLCEHIPHRLCVRSDSH